MTKLIRPLVIGDKVRLLGRSWTTHYQAPYGLEVEVDEVLHGIAYAEGYGSLHLYDGRIYIDYPIELGKPEPITEPEPDKRGYSISLYLNPSDTVPTETGGFPRGATLEGAITLADEDLGNLLRRGSDVLNALHDAL